MGQILVLELQQLEVWRDDRCLLAGLSAALAAGELVHLRGANGAGKTTLLQVVAGLRRPTRGQVCWQGLPIEDERADFRRQLLYLGHLPGIKAALSVQENLQAAAGLRGLAVPGQGLRQALQQVGLSGYEETPVRQLSAGQRRRVALARLWLEPATLWLLDEPFTALDTDGIQALEQRLLAHVSAGGLVLLSSHQPLSPALPVRTLAVADYQPAGDEDAW